MYDTKSMEAGQVANNMSNEDSTGMLIILAFYFSALFHCSWYRITSAVNTYLDKGRLYNYRPKVKVHGHNLLLINNKIIIIMHGLS